MAKEFSGTNQGALTTAMKPIVRVCEEAVQRGLAVIEAGLKERVPERTGRLKSSIHMGPIRVTPDHISGQVIIGSRYATYVEYIPSSRRGHPFLRPTIEQDGPKAIQVMQDTLDKVGH